MQKLLMKMLGLMNALHLASAKILDEVILARAVCAMITSGLLLTLSAGRGLPQTPCKNPQFAVSPYTYTRLRLSCAKKPLSKQDQYVCMVK